MKNIRLIFREVLIMKENLANKYKAMQSDLQKRADSGKLGKLTLSDFECICHLGRELLKHHSVKTYIKSVAEYFKAFGFMVTMDFNNTHFVIVEV